MREEAFSYKNSHGSQERGLSRSEKEDLAESIDFIITHDLRSEELIKMSDFEDVFGKSDVEYDKKELNDIKKRKSEERETLNKDAREAEEDGDRRGRSLEVVMQWLINDMVLFDDFYSMPASEYDDYINGVDILIGLDESDIVLGVDVTTAAHKETTISKKVDRNISKVLEKGASEVKYSYSFRDNKKKMENKSVVPVVIGLDLKNCKDLFSCFVRVKRLERKIDELKKLESDKSKINNYREIKNSAQEELLRLPIYSILFEQIEQQLEKYNSINEKNKEVKSACELFLNKLRKTREDKFGGVDLPDDKVLDNISKKLDIINESNINYFKKAV